LSAQLNQLDNTAAADMSDVSRTIGNSATARALKNKIRNEQLSKTGQVFQTQENANTGIINDYKKQLGEAGSRDALTNLQVDQYNLENKYNYDLWRTGNKNAVAAQTGNMFSQVLGNQAKYQNQLDEATILSNSVDESVGRDAMGNLLKKNKQGEVVKKALGGKISSKKRSLTKSKY